MPDYFAILPYIRTSDRVRFREIEFRSSNDLDGIPAEAAAHVRTLCNLFYLHQGVRIKEMTYAYIKDPGSEEQQTALQTTLREAHMLIAYLYTLRDLRSELSLPFENSTLFVFEEQGHVPTGLIDGSLDERVEFEKAPRPSALVRGYAGTRNWHLWVCADANSRIFPEVPHLILPQAQDFSLNLNDFLAHSKNWPFEEFWFAPRWSGDAEVRQRVLVSLEWHARSCRSSIESGEAIADLAVALESLLKVPDGKDITQRFKDAVMTLLGPVERLDLWLDQFYEARSKTLHEGAPRSSFFFPEKQTRKEAPPKPHRSLLAYGYVIFRLCLGAILYGAVTVGQTRLASAFVTNEERLRSIRVALGQSGRTPEQRLQDVTSIVADLHRAPVEVGFASESELDAVLSAMRALLQPFQETSPSLGSAESLLQQVVSGKQTSTQETLDAYLSLKTALEPYRNPSADLPAVKFLDVVLAFLDYGTQTCFLLAAVMRPQTSKKQDTSTPPLAASSMPTTRNS